MVKKALDSEIDIHLENIFDISMNDKECKSIWLQRSSPTAEYMKALVIILKQEVECIPTWVLKAIKLYGESKT